MNKKLFAALIAGVMISGPALADDTNYVITEKDKEFSPAELTIPAGQKVKITITNLDSSAAEWESADFDREKVVNPGNTITVFIGPVAAGKYSYVDDFHRNSTGIIIAK